MKGGLREQIEISEGECIYIIIYIVILLSVK